jgi:hypothetical protein
LGKRQCRIDYVCALRPHASAVVDDQPNRNRNILMAEMLDRLKNVIFKYLEIAFIESGN